MRRMQTLVYFEEIEKAEMEIEKAELEIEEDRSFNQGEGEEVKTQRNDITGSPEITESLELNEVDI